MAAVNSVSMWAASSTIPAATGDDSDRVISDLCEALLRNAGPEEMKPLIARCSLDTALLKVAARGNSTALRILLDGGANPNAVDSSGTTALLSAVESKSESSVKILLDRSATPDLKDSRGSTPLYVALVGGSEAIVRLLLEGGANPDLLVAGIGRPLEYATKSLRPDLVSALLRGGANPYAELPLGGTVLNSLPHFMYTPLDTRREGLKLPVLEAFLSDFPKASLSENVLSDFYSIVKMMRCDQRSEAATALGSFIRKHDLPASPEFRENLRKSDSSWTGPIRGALNWNSSKGLLMWRHTVEVEASKIPDEGRMKARSRVVQQNRVEEVKKDLGCVCS